MRNDFLNLLKKLSEADVEFVLIGGFAGIVHGCTYVTQDIDICCRFSVSNLLRLQNAIGNLHPVHRMTPTRQPLELTEENCITFHNLYLDTDIGQLDCLGFVKGIGDYDAVLPYTEAIQVEQMSLRLLCIDALIRTKESMNRPHDREAVLQLEAIKNLRTQDK